MFGNTVESWHKQLQSKNETASIIYYARHTCFALTVLEKKNKQDSVIKLEL